MSKRQGHRQVATKRKLTPQLELLFESHPKLINLMDFALPVGRRLVMAIEPGARIEGPRFRGEVLPGSMLIECVRPDGLVETEGRLLIETDDGHPVLVHTEGILAMAPDAARELMDGQPFNPNMLRSFSRGRFEAAEDGPYAWLNRGFYIGRATRTVEGAEALFWQVG